MQTYQPIRGMFICTKGGEYVKAEDADAKIATLKERVRELEAEVSSVWVEYHELKEELEAANAKYRAALEHIEEYWNGDYNEKAMSDACDAVVEIAREAIKED